MAVGRCALAHHWARWARASAKIGLRELLQVPMIVELGGRPSHCTGRAPGPSRTHAPALEPLTEARDQIHVLVQDGEDEHVLFIFPNEEDVVVLALRDPIVLAVIEHRLIERDLLGEGCKVVFQCG